MMFLGNSSHVERIFRFQNRVIRIIKRCGYRVMQRTLQEYVYTFLKITVYILTVDVYSKQ
jgi:hypothetical protein